MLQQFSKFLLGLSIFLYFCHIHLKNLQIHKMKKVLVIIALSISVIACDKKSEVKEVKTAYVDTSKLMSEYTEAKDLEAKYKAQAEEKGRLLEAEINRFKQEASSFQTQAQANGQAWAQQKGAQLQQESGKEMDSLVSGVKKFIKSYGKEKGYSYIFGTGDVASVLYAEDKYDITKELIIALNEKYKAGGAKEEKAPAKK
jgi:outer membrane protein